MRKIHAGDIVTFKPEYQDAGDSQITFIAIDNEEKGRVTVEAQLGWTINPQQVVRVDMIAEKNLADKKGFSKEEILKGIAAMQHVQSQNPPSSEQWIRASRVLHELVKELTGSYPKEARGGQGKKTATRAEVK